MIERPYIGVTGARTPWEASHLVSTFEENDVILETEHQPMIGVLVSHKTLNGMPVPNRRYPAFKNVPQILEATQGFTFNTVHYNSRQMEDLSAQIKGIFVGRIYNDHLSRGLQLNIPWPPVAELIRVKRALPDLKIIMQLSGKSLEGLTPRDVAALVSKYGNLVDYALLDLSGGRGIPFEPSQVAPYYKELKEELPGLSVGFAGGLTGQNVGQKCRELAFALGTKAFSIDAEGGLRDKVTEEYGDDTYNPWKVESYIIEASKALV